MTRKFFLAVNFLLVAIAVAFFAGSDVLAADCNVLHEKIRKERTLMKKKEMVLDALKSCPNSAPIAYQSGYTMERLRKYEDALIQYKKAVKLDSTYAKAYFSVGDIQMLLRNYREAVVAYQLGLLHESGDERAKVSLKEARAKYKQVTGNEAPAPPPPLKKKVVAKQKPVIAKPAEKKKTVVAAPPKAPAPSFAEIPVIRLQVPFFKKSTVLSQDARDVLAVVVGQAMNRPDMKSLKFEIGGHTDNIGDSSENHDISKKRAEVVRSYLVNNFGVAGDRLTIAAHGQKFPKVPNTSPANQEVNRRVEFTKIK